MKSKKTVVPKVAGRELDEMIAIHVMGWKPYGKRTSETWVHPEGWHTSRGAWRSFSSDISAAMEVAERVRRESGFSVYWQFIDCGEFGWRIDLCEAMESDKDATLFLEPASTLPLGICIVALKHRVPAPTGKPSSKTPKMECGDCDGCGWIEGGSALQTTCRKCKGTGVTPPTESPSVKTKVNP